MVDMALRISCDWTIQPLWRREIGCHGDTLEEM